MCGGNPVFSPSCVSLQSSNSKSALRCCPFPPTSIPCSCLLALPRDTLMPLSPWCSPLQPCRHIQKFHLQTLNRQDPLFQRAKPPHCSSSKSFTPKSLTKETAWQRAIFNWLSQPGPDTTNTHRSRTRSFSLPTYSLAHLLPQVCLHNSAFSLQLL